MDPDPDADPAIFVIDFQDANKNQFFKISFSVLFDGSFISFFKDKKSKRSRKTVGITFFLLFLLDDRRIRTHTSD
jgi:hypothetical protein